ncbi:aminoglycoside phosphotransferase family protein [Legionella spiritensis]|uniref:aminoglycoside phosphotransferase family protein n=1 Tax=Legionella spiritensis TaxID=452 RepID=UPI000F6D1E9E|nr:phosphotransferase [Legionella spiritensis]VEG91847.1 putative phosphotransferase [Legionella spiritensis]
MQNRQNALNKWLKENLHVDHFSLTPLTGDASFRRYLRLRYSGVSRIVMDAPPDKEPLRPFVYIADLLRQAGVHTPEIYAYDNQAGFALLEDFGDTLLLSCLNSDTADALYGKAMDTLTLLQACPTSDDHNTLPVFDQPFMMAEMELFRTWFVKGYLQLTLDQQEEALITQTFQTISQDIARQPQVFIHRDYHSRNIMILKDERSPGIIDFQDAMLGPVTYDLVSLLKDCYIQWPRERISRWITDFYEQAPLANQMPLPLFTSAFELCGLQRHLKVLGVFSRLYLRDNKPDYLKDLPLTLHYVRDSLESRPGFQPFYQWMQTRIRLP